ncbi:MAG TPA: YjbE family putative metal transport protein [Kiloniellales bacterium]
MNFDLLAIDLVTLASVVVIDLVLAGDNAIVVGMAACGLSAENRRRVIVWGIAIALVCRIAFALVAVQLLAIIGLLLAGGLLLLWVAWKMWRELRATQFAAALAGDCAESGMAPHSLPVKSVGIAVLNVAIADVSMSLDNVLAVAGTARHNMLLLAFGLVLSVVLMGAAASVVARAMTRYPWLSYLGLGIVTVVALSMIYDGGGEVFTALAGT